MKLALLALVAVVATTHAHTNSTITLISFTGDKADNGHSFREMNDPVMGGESTGTTTIKDGYLIFDGKVVNVPSLKAPGFIQTTTPGHSIFHRETYPDISGCDGIVLRAKQTGSYQGFRLSFSRAHPKGAKFFAYGFKTHFDVGTSFSDVQMPFHDFTSLWDDATGEPIKTCAQDSTYCPDKDTLKNVAPIVLWGEGVAGSVHLVVESIGAYGC